jgi:FdhE protein
MTLKGAVVDPVDIGTVAQPPFVRLPDLTTVFRMRAARLEFLAPGNPMADYLLFVAATMRAQAEVAADLPDGTLPGPADIAFANEHKLPIVDRLTWRRDPSWQAALARIAAALDGVAMPAAASAALAALHRSDHVAREALADRLLRTAVVAEDAATAFFVDAALQLYWTRMAALLDRAAVLPIDPPVLCPICGSPPVGSTVYAQGSLQGVRFLSCPLCSCEWHCVRIKCANCQSTKGIAYHHVAELPAALKAETCDECRTYTKIVYKDKDPDAEPFADDLATVGLDLLVGEAGWARAAANPFLVPGAN